jgi:hypothetical protein
MPSTPEEIYKEALEAIAFGGRESDDWRWGRKKMQRVAKQTLDFVEELQHKGDHQRIATGVVSLKAHLNWFHYNERFWS